MFTIADLLDNPGLNIKEGHPSTEQTEVAL